MSERLDALPEGWAIGTIDNLIGEGVFTDGDWVESKDQDPEGPVRLIQLADIGDGYFVDKSSRYMTEEATERLNCTTLKKSDVLVARMPDPLGRACLMPEYSHESVTVVDVCVIRDKEDNFSPKWLMHFINSPEFRNEIAALQSGSTRKRISRRNLTKIDLPIPPRNEQTRIVEKLEEVLSDLDNGVAELKAAQIKLTQYRQSLLKSAVEGTLTEDWRKQNQSKITETGEQLLARILKERREQWEQTKLSEFEEKGKTPPKDWQKKYPEPVQPDVSELPELPEGWVWANIGQLSSLITSGSRGWAKYYSDSGSLFVRAQNIKTDNLVLDDIAYVKLPESMEGMRTRINRGDILLTITGANVGKCALIKIDIEESFVNQHIALIRPVFSNLSEYLHLNFVNPLGVRKQLDELAYGAGKPGLNLTQIASAVLPLPSEDEIKNICETIAMNVAEVDRKFSQNNTLINHSQAQRKNILNDAFSGKLVQQHPEDEPAQVLLEKIKAERAIRAAQPKPKRDKKKVKTEVSFMEKLQEVLEAENDWLDAQEAFKRCGVGQNTGVDRIEELYAELRRLDKDKGILDIKRVGNFDQIRLKEKAD